MSSTCPAQVEHMSSTDPAQVQHMSSTCPAQVQHMSSTDPAQVQHRFSTCPAHVQHRSSTGPAQVQHRSSTGPAHVQHRSNTGLAQVQHRSSTGLAHVQHRSDTGLPSVLPYDIIARHQYVIILVYPYNKQYANITGRNSAFWHEVCTVCYPDHGVALLHLSQALSHALGYCRLVVRCSGTHSRSLQITLDHSGFGL